MRSESNPSRPLRYMLSPEGRGRDCLELIDPDFAAAEKSGDLIVAGALFGHGHSPGHDHAVLAIREAGIARVVARSFALSASVTRLATACWSPSARVPSVW